MSSKGSKGISEGLDVMTEPHMACYWYSEVRVITVLVIGNEIADGNMASLGRRLRT